MTACRYYIIFTRSVVAGIVRRPGRVLLLALFSLTGWFPLDGAESTPPNPAAATAAEDFRNRLAAAAADFDPAAPPAEFVATDTEASTAVVLFDDDRIYGSGFLCRLWGVPVILTNAHVFARQYESVIKDRDGRTYPIRAALISRNRDLAVIETEVPAGQPLFELNYRPDTLRISAAATVFTPAVGTRDSGTLSGKILAIGPEEFEVSAEFNPGDSGSPVIGRDFRIIGMASYLIYSGEETWITKGTRFNAAVRRFAIRLDKITPEEFECFDPVKQRQELEICNRLVQVYQEFLKEFAETEAFAVRQALFYEKYSRLDIDWDFRPSIAFLDAMYRRELGKILDVAALYGIPLVKPEPEEIRQADAILKILERYRRKQFQCRQCGGRGNIAASEFGNRDKRRQCEACAGAGMAKVPYYELRGSPVGSLVRFAPLTAGRIVPGMEPAMVFRLLERQERDTDRFEVNGVLQNFTVILNRFFPDSSKTDLLFVAGKLGRVDVFFPRNQQLWLELKEKLTKHYGEPMIDQGDGLTGSYLLFARPGGTLSLCLLAFSDARGFIRLTARHNVLTELEFRLIRSLEGKLYIPGHSKQPESGGGKKPAADRTP